MAKTIMTSCSNHDHPQYDGAVYGQCPTCSNAPKKRDAFSTKINCSVCGSGFDMTESASCPKCAAKETVPESETQVGRLVEALRGVGADRYLLSIKNAPDLLHELEELRAKARGYRGTWDAPSEPLHEASVPSMKMKPRSDGWSTTIAGAPQYERRTVSDESFKVAVEPGGHAVPIVAAPQFPRVVWEWISEMTFCPKQSRLVQTAASAWTLEQLSMSKDALGNDQPVWKFFAGYNSEACIPLEPLLSLRAKVDELTVAYGQAGDQLESVINDGAHLLSKITFLECEIEARCTRIANLKSVLDERNTSSVAMDSRIADLELIVREALRRADPISGLASLDFIARDKSGLMADLPLTESERERLRAEQRQPASSGAAGEREPSAAGKPDGAGLSACDFERVLRRRFVDECVKGKLCVMGGESPELMIETLVSRAVDRGFEARPQFDRAKLEPLAKEMRESGALAQIILGHQERAELLRLLEAHGL